MNKIILFLTALFLYLSVSANDTIIYFNGNYRDVSFEDFAFGLEQHGNVKFWFKPLWVEGIRVTAVGEKISLNDLLEQVLAGTGLYFYIDENNNVFITKGIQLSATLPEYIDHTAGKDDPNNGSQEGLTNAELNYKEGRRNGTSETITIGIPGAHTSGRTAVVNGKVTDKETGEALIGATIYIEELEKGYATDLNGHFIMSLSPGTYNAVINCMGMEELHYKLDVNAAGSFEVEMGRKLIAINEVTIKANKFDNVRGLQMGYDRLSFKTIKEIPAVMGERDLLKVAQMLPGVQNVGEGSSGFNIRGSAADQNMFFINKVPVYNTSHLFGFFSAFNSEIVNDFSLYKCNIPAKYGGRLASFFDITSRQGNMKRYTARGGLSPITGHLAAEGPIVKDKSSFIISARTTYSDWILSKLHDADLRKSNASFYDIAGNISIELDSRNFIRIFGYYSDDDFNLAGTNRYGYFNTGASVDWNHQFSSKLSANTTAIVARYGFSNTDTTIARSGLSHNYQIDHYELKSDYTWVPMEKHLFNFGANIIRYGLDRGSVIPAGSESERTPEALGAEKGVESALYFSDEYQLSNRFTIYLGLRYSMYGYLGAADVYDYNPGSPKTENYVTGTKSFSDNQLVKFYSGPEFRLAANYRTGNNSSVKLSYNRTRQYLFMLSNTIALSPTDQWKLCDYHMEPPLADQVSLGYYKDMPKSGMNFSSEIYYKKTLNLVEYKDGADFLSADKIESLALQGEQSAYGLELMLRKNSGKLTGWLSYCYSRSEILVNSPYFWGRINDGLKYPSNYDKPHAVNGVMNLRLNRQLSLAANIVYNTGRPATFPISIYNIEGIEYMHYSARNEYRIPDYFRADLSINIEGNLKAKKFAHSYWMLNFYNITGRKNAYSVYFVSENGRINGYKMSIFGTPIVTLSWNIKLGNYASD
ncbi:MAG: TonB-dependent receptor [Bacteroidales bacterium]|nr:TonB-dependent receptor [Bacteroidales bacterium]